MGFLINKDSKCVHIDKCKLVLKNYNKTKNNKNCKYEHFNTKKGAENYFIKKDVKYSFCKKCNP